MLGSDDAWLGSGVGGVALEAAVLGVPSDGPLKTPLALAEDVSGLAVPNIIPQSRATPCQPSIPVWQPCSITLLDIWLLTPKLILLRHEIQIKAAAG